MCDAHRLNTRCDVFEVIYAFLLFRHPGIFDPVFEPEIGRVLQFAINIRPYNMVHFGRAVVIFLSLIHCGVAFQFNRASLNAPWTTKNTIPPKEFSPFRPPSIALRSATTAAIPVEEDFSSFRPGPEITFGSSGLKLNLFGFVYGFVAISTGLLWYAGLTLCQIQRKLFPNIDKNRRGPIFVGHLWGYILLSTMRCFPIVEGKENLDELYEPGTKRFKSSVMFVANHTSWMDIPYVAMAIGWLNYKMVAKAELLKVPILSKSLRECQHILIDRSSRRSQIKTYKDGLEWLKRGVNLCTFAEGTRSVSGRLQEFKKGAFKMAESVNAPIVPLSIHYAHIVNPKEYVFPMRSSHSVKGKIVVGKPVYPEGKSDEEVMQEVRRTMINNLPPSQRPLSE